MIDPNQMNSDDGSFVDPPYILPRDLLRLPKEVDSKITRSIRQSTHDWGVYPHTLNPGRRQVNSERVRPRLLLSSSEDLTEELPCD